MKYYPLTKKQSLGFTLIELLVVTAILALLMTIATIQIQNNLKDARDAKRTAVLDQIEFALEVYRDANGVYPAAGCGAADGEWAGHGTNADETCDDYISGFSEIIDLPVDPTTGEDGYMYVTDGTSYKMVAFRTVENETVESDHEYAPCPTGCSGACSTATDEFQSSYAVWMGSAYECALPTP